MNFLKYTLVILLSLIFISCWKVNHQLNDAMLFTQQGDFEAALRVYQQILVTRSANPMLLNNYGWTLFKADSLEQAQKVLKTAADLAQNDQQKKMIETNLFMVDQFLSGKWHLKQQNIHEAFRFFNQVTRYYDVREIGFQYQALCYEALKDYHSARKNWEKIVEITRVPAARNPYFILARRKLNLLAQQSIQAGNYEEAIRIYRQIAEAEICDARSHNDLGWALFLNDEFKEAKEILEKAKAACRNTATQDSINTSLFMVKTFLAGEYSLRQNDFTAALSDFEKVTQRYPETDVGLKYTALCFEGLNEKSRADQIWQRLAYLYEGNAYHNKYYNLALSKLKLELD
jgi:tetratricopeptide (TPR) repeat protein